MSIEIKPFYHEAEIEVQDGVTLRLVVNFRAIDRLEALLGVGMDEIIAESSCKVSMATKVLWGLTREHHSDLSFDQLAQIHLASDRREAVQATLGHLMKTAFNLAGDAEEGEQSRPPRKRSSGRRRGSSRNGARPA